MIQIEPKLSIVPS